MHFEGATTGDLSVDASAALRISHSAHPGSSFIDVNLTRSQFKNVGLQGALFEDAELKGAVLRNVDLSDVSIEDANVEGAKINGILISELLRVYLAGR